MVPTYQLYETTSQKAVTYIVPAVRASDLTSIRFKLGTSSSMSIYI